LTLEYEGTRYRGFQEQKNARTVAGELRRALEAATGGAVELGGAGRTDAGVHALEQAAHLRTPARVEPRRLVERVNDLLPADIHLLDLRPAPPRFHARHDARLRSYLYQLARRRTALAKRFVWWIERPLASERMAAAAAALAGTHDFARFCEQPEEQTSTRVAVERAEVGEEGDLVLVRIAASHFLWKMVRRVVGALVEVGAGTLPVEEFARLLAPGAATALSPAAQPARSSSPAAQPARSLSPAAHTARTFSPAAHTAPPSGLFLERVIYAGDAPLGPLAAAVPVAGREVR
jgi:tRNA pseudouridine38-40 synthase